MNYFDRVPMSYRPLLERAISLLPPKVRQAVPDHFLCGVDPRWVGLHYSDAHPYNRWAHACYPWHSADGVPRVVIPTIEGYIDPVGVVIHEVGHLFHQTIHFAIDCPETTKYSRTNSAERFAEGFEFLLRPPSGDWALRVEAEDFRPLREAVFG